MEALAPFIPLILVILFLRDVRSHMHGPHRHSHPHRGDHIHDEYGHEVYPELEARKRLQKINANRRRSGMPPLRELPPERNTS